MAHKPERPDPHAKHAATVHHRAPAQPAASPAAPTVKSVPVSSEPPENFRLPVMAAEVIDVIRLNRELAVVDDTLLQLSLRTGGSKVDLPKVSHLLEELARVNNLNLLQEEDRKHLKAGLDAAQTSAPVLHMSFGSDPSAAFLEKLVNWLRKEVHPMVLLTIGLQPNIGAGCVVRSTNKYYDFSLRQQFTDKKALLLEKLNLPAPPPAPETAPATQGAA